MVNCAAHADAGAQDLLDGAGQLPRAAAVAHDASDLDDLIKLKVAAVLDVLLLHHHNRGASLTAAVSSKNKSTKSRQSPAPGHTCQYVAQYMCHSTLQITQSTVIQYLSGL